MKKAFLIMLLLYNVLFSASFFEECRKNFSLGNCVIVAMLVHSIWTWHTTRIEIAYCEQALRKNDNEKNCLVQEWRNQKLTEDYKEKDTCLDRKEYCELLSKYSSINRTLEIRQIRATVKKEQSIQGILAGIAGQIVKLY